MAELVLTPEQLDALGSAHGVVRVLNDRGRLIGMLELVAGVETVVMSKDQMESLGSRGLRGGEEPPFDPGPHP